MSLVQESNVEPKTIKKSSHIIAFSSCVAMACSSMLMSTGCGTEHVASSQVSLEIRFQDDTAPTPQSSAGQLRIALAAPGPTTHDTVARILVDVTIVDSGLPFFTNFDLTKITPDVWRGDVPLLPRDQQLRFAARALDANGDVGFSGETVATLTVDNQDVQIPLAPAQNGQTFQMPRLFRIAYPAQIQAGAEEQIAFTILDNAGASVAIQIPPLGSPMTPSADFSPATGTVTLTNTVADFMTVYTAPDVTTDTDFDYQVTITDDRTQSAVAITTNFRTHIIPRPPGTPIVHNIHPSVQFNPVILSLTANGSDTPGTVELVANASDDSTPDHLTVQWSFAPNAGTSDVTFANGGLGNPGLFQGYTVDHEGTITLAVTDENNDMTTLHYTLTPGQFADAIDHASVNGLKRIVSGSAHTCVLTGENKVRCWGDNQFGQLGYGNTIDVGDAPTRLPFTAGDLPLPSDPTTHLPLDPVQQLVAGHNHTCALLASGLVYCWGLNSFGQLGYNRTDNLGDGEPVTSFGYVTLGDLATRIAAGGDHTCAILQSGALRCWGRNDFGQLGHGNTANIGDNETVFSAGDIDLGPGVMVKDLALGESHTCTLLATGAVRCWGRGREGQLGYGNANNLGDNEPINNLPNVSLTGAVRKIVAGDLHTCALTFAGTLRCWGDGFEGELGQNFGGGDVFWGNAANEFPSTLTSDITTGAQVTDVAAGARHTCALSSDGKLKCWGLGSSGQLGYGDTANQLTPPAAGVDLDGVTAYRISTGAVHSCALRRNGTARCWGAGTDGRLGRGSTASSATATGDVDIQIFAPTCGNGMLDPGEQCDDGNTINGDACDINCTVPACGNGIIDPGEQCDNAIIPTSGMHLWLRADAGVNAPGNRMTRWLDQSGNGRNASMVTASRQPFFAPGALNGLPAARFAGAQSMLLDLPTDPVAFSVFVVGKNSNPNESFSMILGSDFPNHNNQLRWDSGSVLLLFNETPGQTFASPIGDTRVYHTLSARYDGATLSVFRDGSLVTSHGFSAGPWRLTEVGSWGSAVFMQGDLSEVLIYSRALSDAELALVSKYLRGKYNLP